MGTLSWYLYVRRFTSLYVCVCLCMCLVLYEKVSVLCRFVNLSVSIPPFLVSCVCVLIPTGLPMCVATCVTTVCVSTDHVCVYCISIQLCGVCVSACSCASRYYNV